MFSNINNVQCLGKIRSTSRKQLLILTSIVKEWPCNLGRFQEPNLKKPKENMVRNTQNVQKNICEG